MKKLINALNDDRIGGMIFGGFIVVVITAMMVFSCLRDEAGLGMVRQPAPLELTECSTCSP